MQKLKNEIREKKVQMRVLEQRMVGSEDISPYTSSSVEMSQAFSRLATQLNEKTFELEVCRPFNFFLLVFSRHKWKKFELNRDSIFMLLLIKD